MEKKAIKSYINEKEYLNKAKDRLTLLTEKDILLFERVKKLRVNILTQLVGSNYLEKAVEHDSEPLLFFYMDAIREMSRYTRVKIIENILSFKKEYSDKFSLNNLVEKRNPILQLLIGNLNKAIINMINMSTIEDQAIYELTRGTEKATLEEKIDLMNAKKSFVEHREKDVRDVLTGIDNIYYIDKFDVENITSRDSFLICVNTHQDIDDPNKEERMLDVREEVVETVDMCKRSNLNELILVNLYNRNFLNFLSLLKPKYLHYIGHSQKGFLRFRSRQQVSDSDISTAYDNQYAEYVFLNSCFSRDIAQELSKKCAHRSIGYKFSLFNTIAKKLCKNLYTEKVVQDILPSLDLEVKRAIKKTEPFIKDYFKDSYKFEYKNAYLLVKHYEVFEERM